MPHLDHFDCHELARQLVDGKVYLSEGALTYLFDELIEVETSRWELLVLAEVLPIVLDDLVSVFANLLVQSQQPIFFDVTLFLMN